MLIYPLNFLITNVCNQNCPFCFAHREMNTRLLAREMSMAVFKNNIKKLKRGGYKGSIKLLGGEPTLHTKLFEMIEEAIKDGYYVHIFTNGIIERKKINRLTQYGNKVGYSFNVLTPGFKHNLRLREQILSNMKILRKKSNITISITFDPFFKLDTFFQQIPQEIWKNISGIRIGISNPIAGEKNWYSFTDFSRIGSIIAVFINKIKLKGFNGSIKLNCGFTRCMFTEKEYRYIQSQVKILEWSCFGKESSMDIAVDESAFHCFSLSNQKRVDLTVYSYANAARKLIKKRMKLWAHFKMKNCAICPFYGYGEKKCPGPCLAFRMNEFLRSNAK